MRKYATIYEKIRNNLRENTQQFTRKYATIYEKIRNNLYCEKIRNNILKDIIV